MLGLGVGWGSGKTVSLDSEVGAGSAHGEVEESEVTPVSAPGVATDPVLLLSGGILAVTNDGDLVVDLGEGSQLSVDVVSLAFNDRGVLSLELVCGVNTAGDGAVSVELSHHSVLALHAVVIGDIVVGVLDSLTVSIGSLALGGRGAVTADIVRSAHVVDQVVGGVLLT